MPEGLSLMKRVCVVFHQNPDSYLSVTDIHKGISKLLPNVKKKTIQKYVERLNNMGIIEKRSDGSGASLFKCVSQHLTQAYVEGRHEFYAGQVPPQTPERPISTVKHRPAYPMRLDGGEAARVRQFSQYKKHGRAPGFYETRTDNFYLRMWSSGKVHLFVNGPCMDEFRKLFGDSVADKAVEAVCSRNGHVGIARDLPAGAKPEDMPLGQVFRVNEPDGSVTVFQYGYSQKDDGELDRHGRENAPNGNRVESWLYDETKFKADVSNKFSSIDHHFTMLDEKLEKLPDKVGEAVRNALKELLNPDKQEKYPVAEVDPNDTAYR